LKAPFVLKRFKTGGGVFIGRIVKQRIAPGGSIFAANNITKERLSSGRGVVVLGGVGA
jgi:hypothetical protein